MTQHRAILEKYEVSILAAPRVQPLLLPDWAAAIPKEAGVYVVWEKNLPVYVGESSSLRLRMGDFARPINHPFPKKVCALLGIKEKAYREIATAVSSQYKLSWLAVPFGRVELEEFLILRWRGNLLNKPTKRLLTNTQYGWVVTV